MLSGSLWLEIQFFANSLPLTTPPSFALLNSLVTPCIGVQDFIDEQLSKVDARTTIFSEVMDMPHIWDIQGHKVFQTHHSSALF